MEAAKNITPVEPIVEWQLDSLKSWIDRINSDIVSDDFSEAKERCQNEALRFFINNKDLDTTENREYFRLK